MSPALSTRYGSTLILSVALVAAACTSSPKVDPKLQHQIDDLALNAQRDSLLQEVAANSRLLSDIEAELATVRKPAASRPESPELNVTLDDRELVLAHVREVAGRLKEVQKRLTGSERRVQRLTATSDSLRKGLSAADSTIGYLNSLVEAQRATVATLGAQIETLLTENATLADSVFHLSDEQRTAYYVIGTRKELIKKGVLVEDGHRSIPLVGRRGVAPARDLPIQEFTSIDRSRISEIPLPDSTRKYRIVSRQSPAYLSEANWKNAVRGSIRIRDAEAFWEPSRYLIVVAE